MTTLLTTLISFLAGGVPKLLDFFQNRANQSHELAMAAMQKEKELALAAQGFASQARIAEIHVEEAATNAAASVQQALLTHDTSLAQGASQGVINARALVRPIITYGLFLLFVAVEAGMFVYAWQTGVQFDKALAGLWSEDTQTTWASILAFWFGGQAFKRAK